MVVNTEYTLAATYDASTNAGLVYLNGIHIGSGTATLDANDVSYQLGGLGGVTTTTMRGSLGEVLIYNRVLTTTQRGNVETYLQNKSIAPANTPLTTYSIWTTSNIPMGQDSSATGDFNNNGITNLVEFALGLDPTKFSYPPLLSLTTSPGQVIVSYLRPTNRTAVTYELLESTNMQTWTPITDVFGNVANGIESRSSTRPLSPTQNTFYRLRVSIP